MDTTCTLLAHSSSIRPQYDRHSSNSLSKHETIFTLIFAFLDIISQRSASHLGHSPKSCPQFHRLVCIKASTLPIASPCLFMSFKAPPRSHCAPASSAAPAPTRDTGPPALSPSFVEPGVACSLRRHCMKLTCQMPPPFPEAPTPLWSVSATALLFPTWSSTFLSLRPSQRK